MVLGRVSLILSGNPVRLRRKEYLKQALKAKYPLSRFMHSVCRSVLILQPGQEESDAEEESNVEAQISAEDEIYSEEEIDVEENIKAKEDVDGEEGIYAEEGIYTEDEEIYAKENGTDSDSGKLGTLSRYIYIRTLHCTALNCTALNCTSLHCT